MSFGDIDAVRRTDEMFRNKEQKEHHKERSVIEYLDIDMVQSFTIADPLHLLELGMNLETIVIHIYSDALSYSKHIKQNYNHLRFLNFYSINDI